LLTTYQPVFVLGTLLEPESSAVVAVEVEAAAAAIITFSLRKAGNAEGDRKAQSQRGHVLISFWPDPVLIQ
jgi:hypothetical protein